MRTLNLNIALAAMAASGLCGCVKGDYASITISYRAAPTEIQLSLQPPVRQRIVTAFKAVAPAKGFKCRAHVKRVEELTCRGPRGMNMTFKPELNRPAFVAKFNWVESNDRTRDEFARHIEEFASSMASAVTDADVRKSEVRSEREKEAPI